MGIGELGDKMPLDFIDASGAVIILRTVLGGDDLNTLNAVDLGFSGHFHFGVFCTMAAGAS